MKAKSFAKFFLSALIVSQSIHIASAQASSRADLSQKIVAETTRMARIQNELDILIKEIREEEVDYLVNKKLRNVSLSISALGLVEIAAVIVYARVNRSMSPNRGINIEGLFYLGAAIPGAVALAGGALVASGSQIAIVIGSNNLTELRQQLEGKKSEVQKIQADLIELKLSLE
jgi:hypothetical protein